MATNLPPLPSPRSRRLLGAHRERQKITLTLETVTPILGGGTAPRTVDDKVDVVRVPSIRGQLRFWWRALYGHGFADHAEVAKREAEIWGGIARAGGDEGKRSAVDVTVTVERRSEKDTEDISFKAPAAYALWPARKGKQDSEPAPRWKPGLRFRLTVNVEPAHEEEVRRAIRAWILFGGYGGRTRRGCGSLTVVSDDKHTWLPKEPTRKELGRLLGSDAFAAVEARAAMPDLPRLRGATLCIGSAVSNGQGRNDRTRHGQNHNDCARNGQPPKGEAAWLDALRWLKDFRQGAPERKSDDTVGAFAREGPPEPSPRPGRSNWPEADKVRRLAPLPRGATQWAHDPVDHNSTPVWPRASFGLPIVGQFQRNGRDNRRYRREEPPDFTLQWREKKGEVRDRLASPLIVKAMALADGSFVPIALWLHRAYPTNGEVVLLFEKGVVAGSAAPFDKLVADGDYAVFAPLNDKPSMRDAFIDWLLDPRGQRRVRKL